MIKRIRRAVRVPRKDGPQSRSGARYDTGYGKPPRQNQFRPGHSGNPKGRPKGAKNTATLVREILDRKIEVRTGGTVRKISVREAMLTRFTESGLKGNTKSAAFLLQHYDMPETADEHANSGPTPDEQEIIDEFVKEYLKKKGKNE